MSIITMLILLINSTFVKITPQKSIPSKGYIVVYVENNSIAQGIGLKVGDIVLSENGKSLSYKRKYIGLFGSVKIVSIMKEVKVKIV